MRKSTVIIIVAVIAALIVIRGVQEMARRGQKTPPGGDFVKILPEDMRAADMQKLEIYRGDKKQDAIVLEKSKEGWVVPSRFNSKGNEKSINEFLDDVKKLTGEVRTKKASLHQDFGITAEKAVHVTMYDKNGKLYRDLLLGKKGERWDEGFVRLGDSNKVYLADKNLLGALGMYGESDNPDAKKWLDLKIIDKKKEELAKIALDMPGKQVVLEKKEKKKEEKEEKPEEGEKPAETAPKEEKKEYEWVLASPKTDFKLKDGAVNSVLSSISQLNGEDVADPAKMNEYGFDSPTYTATITLEDNSAETLLVGKKTEKDEKRYAKLKDKSTIYILAQYTVTGVFKKMRDLVEINVWDLKREDIASINLQRREYEILLERRVKAGSEAKEKKEEKDYEWVLVKPETRFKLEDFRVPTMLSRLTKPTPDDFFVTGEPQTYGLDAPEFKAVLKMNDGSAYTASFGKKIEDSEDRYVKFEGKDYVYSYGKYNLETLFPKLPKLVSVKVMEELTKDNVASLKYDTAEEDFVLSRKGTATEAEKKQWLVKTDSEESEAKAATADDILGDLTGLRPEDIAIGKSDGDCGLDKPTETLVISTDKAADRYTLLFGKKVAEDSADRYFKIKDQPEIFVLSNANFDNIFRKLKDLKVEKPVEPQKEEKPTAEQKSAPSVEQPPMPPKEEKPVAPEGKPAPVKEEPKESPEKKEEKPESAPLSGGAEPPKEKPEPSAPETQPTPPAQPEEKKEEKPAPPEEAKPAPQPPAEKPLLEKAKDEIPAPPVPTPPTPKEPIPLPSKPERDSSR